MKFKAGQSGNPAGKPRGATDKRTELRELLRPHQDELITKVVALAKEGDPTALKIIFDRLMPPLRPRDELVQFEMTGDTLTEKAHSVLFAIARGQLTPDQGIRLLEAVSTCARIQAIEEAEGPLDRRTMRDAYPISDMSDEELLTLVSPTCSEEDPTQRVREMVSLLKTGNSNSQINEGSRLETDFVTNDNKHYLRFSEEHLRARIDELFAEPVEEAWAAELAA